MLIVSNDKIQEFIKSYLNTFGNLSETAYKIRSGKVDSSEDSDLIIDLRPLYLTNYGESNFSMGQNAVVIFLAYKNTLDEVLCKNMRLYLNPKVNKSCKIQQLHFDCKNFSQAITPKLFDQQFLPYLIHEVVSKHCWISSYMRAIKDDFESKFDQDLIALVDDISSQLESISGSTTSEDSFFHLCYVSDAGKFILSPAKPCEEIKFRENPSRSQFNMNEYKLLYQKSREMLLQNDSVRRFTISDVKEIDWKNPKMLQSLPAKMATEINKDQEPSLKQELLQRIFASLSIHLDYGLKLRRKSTGKKLDTDDELPFTRDCCISSDETSESSVDDKKETNTEKVKKFDYFGEEGNSDDSKDRDFTVDKRKKQNALPRKNPIRNPLILPPNEVKETESITQMLNQRKMQWWTPRKKYITSMNQLFDELCREPAVTWDQEGRMFVHMFDAHERQAYLEAILKFGMPKPGLLPSADWLPPMLQKKDPVYIWAYQNLFMRHLYEDPLALDDSVEHWSDGLPKEGVSGAAVLSRIAILALLREKVIEFEDLNMVMSDKSAVNSYFQFNIYDGELTLLHSQWKSDWRKIDEIFASYPNMTPCEIATVVSFHWHRRHDFWLLAAILVHGYGSIPEIIKDERFEILFCGLKGAVPEFTASRQSDPSLQLVQPAIMFLFHRLRLLEQALIVEQSLFNVALTASLDSDVEFKPDAVTDKHRDRALHVLKTLSSRLSSVGPRKQITLPVIKSAADSARRAVKDLQSILEDLHADLEYLPAIVWCIEEDDQESPKLVIAQ
ncbi:hypothetical protein Ciccas_000020 [Cichlidogyrus casuarinus]|uniref:CHD subfamily II SANT-like domain-containing protein n=1 Tax=Cichlidogyrus casuarinus TaxID=1844966 RepID=A0ABD2QPG0_9PLAT